MEQAFIFVLEWVIGVLLFVEFLSWMFQRDELSLFESVKFGIKQTVIIAAIITLIAI
jgi:hypothetical protein